MIDSIEIKKFKKLNTRINFNIHELVLGVYRLKKHIENHFYSYTNLIYGKLVVTYKIYKHKTFTNPITPAHQLPTIAFLNCAAIIVPIII